jgi:hypothetical protein
MKSINSGIRNAGRPQNLKLTGNKLVKDIKERTTKGYEAKSLGSTQTRFKKLKESTVRRRKSLKNKGQLSNKTTPGLSNQTRHGKMVKSLNYTAKRNELSLHVSDDQKRKLKENRELGRNFLELSRNNLKMITVDIVNYIANAIERNLK